uniref:Nuclear transport factor 2 family protein n=1 Tax=candidate division WOR-3 bacterium TaxID=2052148 RepID=A0A7C6EBM2_UNCW3
MTGKKAVENEDLATVMSLVAEDYEDDFGMDYERLRRWFINHFRNYDDIKVFIPYKKIIVNDGAAICSLRVTVQAKNRNTNEPEVIYGYSAWGDELILDLRKLNKKWFFKSAHP